jgi:hypothetical protein
MSIACWFVVFVAHSSVNAEHGEEVMMGEIKRAVQPIEINYICDNCQHGMMKKSGEMNEDTGDILHNCVICGHQQTFQWIEYPRIDYVGEGEKF